MGKNFSIYPWEMVMSLTQILAVKICYHASLSNIVLIYSGGVCKIFVNIINMKWWIF